MRTLSLFALTHAHRAGFVRGKAADLIGEPGQHQLRSQRFIYLLRGFDNRLEEQAVGGAELKRRPVNSGVHYSCTQLD